MKFFLFIACILICVNSYPQKNISYNLPYSGRVSLNIYDESGKIIRELLQLAERKKGMNTEMWDMKDTEGNPVDPSKKYSWKILLGNGIKAKYLLTIGPSFPEGKNYWETGLGNHIGVSSVAADDQFLYVAAGIAENVRSHLKMDKQGKKCFQSGNQPGAWTGFYARTVIGDYVYGLTQQGMILAHHKDSLNSLFSGIGTYRQSTCAQQNTGFGWNARWPSDTSLPFFQCDKPASGNYEIWQNIMSMDICSLNWNGRNYIVISYADYNSVQVREPLTGTIVKSFLVDHPKGITGDKNGNIYLLSKNNLVRINCNNGNQVILNSSLRNPYRIDIDIKRKELLIAEREPLNQVKKFTSAGKLIKTYGVSGGRKDGLYKATDFSEVNDILADGSGGFFVTESFPVNRLAHFGSNGLLIKEWYGGTNWVPLASTEEDDPSVVWLQLQKNVLARCQIDYAKRSWKIHSVYNLDKVAGGIYSTDSLRNCGMCGVVGAGLCMWEARKRNSETYFVFRNAVAVCKLDTVNWKLKGCVATKYVQNNSRNTQVDIYSWTDLNGNGFVEETEKKVYHTSKYIWDFRGIEAPSGFDYYWFSQTANAVISLPVIKWTEKGVPLYPEYGQETVFNKDNFSSVPISLSQSDYFSFDKQSKLLFVTINYGEKGWANVSGSKLFCLDSAGRFKWVTGDHADRAPESFYWYRQPKPSPGKIYAFKNNVGVVNGVVVATDYEGSWNEPYYLKDSVTNKTAITYTWDTDGLYAGDVFDDWDAGAGKKWKYQHSSDNGSGLMVAKPGSRDVYYLAGCENEVRIYLLTGFDSLLKLSGTLPR